MYIARQLSFQGVTFDVKEVKLCPSFIEMYDASVKLVRMISMSFYHILFYLSRHVDISTLTTFQVQSGNVMKNCDSSCNNYSLKPKKKKKNLKNNFLKEKKCGFKYSNLN